MVVDCRAHVFHPVYHLPAADDGYHEEVRSDYFSGEYCDFLGRDFDREFGLDSDPGWSVANDLAREWGSRRTGST
jgi:hypothetical protein